jgi:Icc-related predicted phosphoesterase
VSRPVRIAAVGDVHFSADSAGVLKPALKSLAERADMLLLAGDLTRRGLPAEAAVLAEELRELELPVLAVLGNHDYHADEQDRVRAVIEQAGILVLEGDAHVLKVRGTRVAIAGVKGFCGGFAGAASEFGEPEMKAFAALARISAESLQSALAATEAEVKVALVHYAPIEATLVGERPEVWPFLGSYLLAQSIDRAGADICIHGHAHGGSEKGLTPGGVPVRNVAQAVIKRAYALYELEAERAGRSEPRPLLESGALDHG